MDIKERLRLRDGMVFPDPNLFRDALETMEALESALTWALVYVGEGPTADFVKDKIRGALAKVRSEP